MERYFRSAPRVVIEPGKGVTEPIRQAIGAALTETAKIDVLAGADEAQRAEVVAAGRDQDVEAQQHAVAQLAHRACTV